MKKTLLTIIITAVISIAGTCVFYKYFTDDTYKYIETLPKRKLVREIVVDCKGAEDYNRYGIYKKVYRVYNYTLGDTIYKSSSINRSHHINMFMSEQGDTLRMEYYDTSNYPRRED